MLYVFADCVLDIQLYTVQRAGRTVRLRPKALDDSGRAQRLIQTLHGRGYRFVAAVEARPTSHPESAAQPADSRFDQAGSLLPAATVPHAPDWRAAIPRVSPPRHLADKILALRRTLEGERKQVTVLWTMGLSNLPRGGALEGERKQVTVLCAAVVGLRSLAERLDSDDLHTLIGGCFALLAEQVHRYEGVITQCTSDDVMVLFGDPIAHEDHTVRALHTALGSPR